MPTDIAAGPRPGRANCRTPRRSAKALAQAMQADPRVFLFGEDIGVYGGAFGVSGDLVHRFGAERVIDTPISELGIAGAAVGAAITGMKPVLELQFSDFVTLAMEQLVNQAAKIHFMFGGKATVPMVVRLPGGVGHGRRRAAQPEPRSVVRPRSGPEGRAAVDAARRQGPAAGGDRRSQPGADLRAQAAATRRAARCRKARIACRSARRRSGATGRDLTIVGSSIMAIRAAAAAARLAPRRISTPR